MDGWMGGWMGGWVDGRAGLRIAYSNQKVKSWNVGLNFALFCIFLQDLDILGLKKRLAL